MQSKLMVKIRYGGELFFGAEYFSPFVVNLALDQRAREKSKRLFEILFQAAIKNSAPSLTTRGRENTNWDLGESSG